MTNKASSSGLEFHIHPLVLINISDHSTRVHANFNTEEPRTRVLGCLLGQQTGRVVDIVNSLEIRYEDGPDGTNIDEVYMAKKQEQYKQVFSKLDTVGWYSTGQSIGLHDMQIHKLIMNINESPVFLLLDDNISAKHKNLPVNLYESELHTIDGHPQSVFVESKYKIETSEAERIGINQIAKVLPRGSDKSSDQLAAQYASLHAAVKMLHSRLALLSSLLGGMQQGEVPYDHSIVRQTATLVRQLPAIRAAPFHKSYIMDINDTSLCVLMSSITKGCDALNDVVDKVNTAYDKTARRRGGML